MQKARQLITKYQIFLSTFFVLICTLGFHKILSRHNERDTLVFARHTFDPSYISGDWYLSQSIPYRLLFDYPFGWLTSKIPMHTASLLIGIFFIMLFAAAVQYLAGTRKVSWLPVLPLMVLFSVKQYFVAQEWMIGAVETKPFAYIFAIAALGAFINKKYLPAFLLSGLSVSFHLLVGGYSCICLFFCWLINENYFRKDFFKIIRSFTVFPVIIAPSLYLILQQMKTDSYGVDSVRAALIYVTLRVPHHTLPSEWGWKWIITLTGFTLFFIILRLRSRDEKLKIISGYAIGALVLFYSGLCIYAAGKTELMKYYFFRYPAVILPFLTGIIILFYLSELYARFSTAPGRIRIITRSTAYITAAATTVFCVSTAINDIRTTMKNPLPHRVSAPADFINCANWIRTNTSPDSIFLNNPSNMNFYLFAERSVLVSYKHSPQTDRYIIEWYDRISAITGEQIPLIHTPWSRAYGRNLNEKINTAYRAFTAKDLKRIISKYRIDYYLAENSEPMPYRKVFSSGKYILWKIRN